MQESIKLIDEMLQEHGTIMSDIKCAEDACSDATALKVLDQADRDFSPGRLNRAEGLKKLQETIATCESGIAGHFSREENSLLEIFKKHADEKLIADFHGLLRQHGEINDRLAHAKKEAERLAGGEISGGHWNATANDLMTYMNKTRKMIEEHAAAEGKLFRSLRNQLSQG